MLDMIYHSTLITTLLDYENYSRSRLRVHHHVRKLVHEEISFTTSVIVIATPDV